MAIGKVKWFNNAKGYGFILPESGNGDLFVHYSSIQMEGYKTLKAGQEVEFDTVAGPKGQHAVNIRRLSVDEDTELEAPPRTSEESPDRDEFPDQDEFPDRDE